MLRLFRLHEFCNATKHNDAHIGFFDIESGTHSLQAHMQTQSFKGNALKKYHAKIKEEREEASTSDDEESVMTMKAVERKAPIDKHTTSSNGPATGANAIPIDNPPPETDTASGMDCDE